MSVYDAMLYCKYSSFFSDAFSSAFFYGGDQMNSVICVWFYIPIQTYSHMNCIKPESDLHKISPTEGTARKSWSQGRFAHLVTRAVLQTDSQSHPEHLSDGWQ